MTKDGTSVGHGTRHWVVRAMNTSGRELWPELPAEQRNQVTAKNNNGLSSPQKGFLEKFFHSNMFLIYL